MKWNYEVFLEKNLQVLCSILKLEQEGRTLDYSDWLSGKTPLKIVDGNDKKMLINEHFCTRPLDGIQCVVFCMAYWLRHEWVMEHGVEDYETCEDMLADETAFANLYCRDVFGKRARLMLFGSNEEVAMQVPYYMQRIAPWYEKRKLEEGEKKLHY